MNITIVDKRFFNELMQIRQITNENIESFEKTCFISIADAYAEKYFEQDKSNLKVLTFDDIETDLIEVAIMGEDEFYRAKGISTEQAESLVEFIEQNKDKPNCLVHCTAGISRSGAVGTFINQHYNNDSQFFYTKHPRIRPNKRVLAYLEDAYKRKIT